MQLYEVNDYWNIIINKLINSCNKKIKSFISFLLSSSLFLAFNGFLKTYYSFLLFGVIIKWDLLLAMFLTTFAVYCINKLTDKEEDAVNSPERANFVNGNEKYLGFILVISYITAIILGLSESIYAMLVLLFPLCTGIIYSIKLSPRIPRLKDIFGVKSLIVALNWTIVPMFLPLVSSSKVPLILIISVFCFFFVKTFANTVLFDIRDIEGDKKSGIKTIPIGIGKSRTKKILSAFTLSLAPLILLLFINGLPFVIFLTMTLGIINTYWYIRYICSNSETNGTTMQLLIDGEWFFVLAFTFIINAV